MRTYNTIVKVDEDVRKFEQEWCHIDCHVDLKDQVEEQAEVIEHLDRKIPMQAYVWTEVLVNIQLSQENRSGDSER